MAANRCLDDAAQTCITCKLVRQDTLNTHIWATQFCCSMPDCTWGYRHSAPLAQRPVFTQNLHSACACCCCSGGDDCWPVVAAAATAAGNAVGLHSTAHELRCCAPGGAAGCCDSGCVAVPTAAADSCCCCWQGEGCGLKETPALVSCQGLTTSTRVACSTWPPSRTPSTVTTSPSFSLSRRSFTSCMLPYTSCRQSAFDFQRCPT
jgi:hypothetical protein